MNFMRRLIQTAILIFLVLLPLKFTHTVGVPAVPASYWGDPASLIFTGWSPYLFTLVSAVFAVLAGILLIRKQPSRELIPGLLWAGLTVVSLLTGWVSASCSAYVREASLYMAGLCCFAGMTSTAALEDETFLKKMLGAVLTGIVLTVVAGWDQWFNGLNEVRQFVEENELSGTLSKQMRNQIASSRIYGTFQLCNTYAGYLAASAPLLIGAAWLWAGKRIQPKLPAQILLAVIAAAAVLTPMILTGSRGAILSLAAGIGLVLLFAAKMRKTRLILSGGIAVTAILFTVLVICGRGFESMVFRLDYDQAALKMMIRENWFCGTGWGDFFHDYPGLKLLINDEAPHSPHNLPLWFGSQCGILAFLLSLFVLALPVITGLAELRRLIRENEDREKMLRFAFLLMALVVLTLDSLLEVMAEVPACMGLLIVLQVCVMMQTKPLEYGWKKMRYALPVFGLMTAAAVCVWGIPQETSYAELFETVNPQFSREPSNGVPSPAAVRTAFQKCDLNSPFPYLTLAGYLERIGRFEAAEQAVTEARKYSPEDTGTLRRRFRLRMRLNHPGAAEDLEEIRRRDPNNPRNNNIKSNIEKEAKP